MAIKHSTLFFGIAVVCLLFLLSAKSILDLVFPNTDSAVANTNQTTGSTIGQQLEDPLVTVVPKDVIAGTPQPLSSDPQVGAANPTVTIVEFGDFECDTCATMSPVFAQIVREYPNDVRLVWKDYPLPKEHLYSEIAALAARCAQDQDAFWEYHDMVFARQKEFANAPWADIATTLSLDTAAFTSCLETKEKKPLVVQGYFVARTFNLDIVPSYYINTTLVTGVKTYEELKAIVDTEIANATQ